MLSASGLEVVEPIAALSARTAAWPPAWRSQRALHRRDRALLYGEQKAQAARDFAAARGYRLADCHAYSDSITDLPLLEAVGHPTAVNPDRALRRVAAERGWPVLTFAIPSRCARGSGRPRPARSPAPAWARQPWSAPAGTGCAATAERATADHRDVT